MGEVVAGDATARYRANGAHRPQRPQETQERTWVQGERKMKRSWKLEAEQAERCDNLVVVGLVSRLGFKNARTVLAALPASHGYLSNSTDGQMDGPKKRTGWYRKHERRKEIGKEESQKEEGEGRHMLTYPATRKRDEMLYAARRRGRPSRVVG